MFGRDFEVCAWSRSWRWNLIKICVWTCLNFGEQNSTLGSVVPLAMFDSSLTTDSLIALSLCFRSSPMWQSWLWFSSMLFSLLLTYFILQLKYIPLFSRMSKNIHVTLLFVISFAAPILTEELTKVVRFNKLQHNTATLTFRWRFILSHCQRFLNKL